MKRRSNVKQYKKIKNEMLGFSFDECMAECIILLIEPEYFNCTKQDIINELTDSEHYESYIERAISIADAAGMFEARETWLIRDKMADNVFKPKK